MNSPSSFTFDLATDADATGLVAVYDSDDGFAGDIAVKFTRGADPLESLRREGESVVVPVGRDATGRIIGMGACVIRDAYVNGDLTTVGYLTGLKSMPEFRRRTAAMIPPMYRFLREQSAQVSLYYTTILESNTLARRLLERRRPNMPEYREVGRYTAYAFRRGVPAMRHSLTGGTLAELIGLRGDAARFNLAAPTLPVSDADVRILRDGRGAPLAGCVVWDRSSAKQYVITGYGGRYETLAKLPVHLAGWPRLPAVGAPADYVVLGLLAARDDDPTLLRHLFNAVGFEQRHRDFVMVGLVEGHPWATALAGVRAIEYRSIVYTVHFDHGSPGLDGRPLDVEVALL